MLECKIPDFSSQINSNNQIGQNFANLSAHLVPGLLRWHGGVLGIKQKEKGENRSRL